MKLSNSEKSDEMYQNLTEEERNKKRENGCERYKNLSGTVK